MSDRQRTEVSTVSDLIATIPFLQQALDSLSRRHDVPGAVLGVLDGEHDVEVATGVTSRETGVEVTPETLFQIGSVTKLYTTTLVLQLADEGLVELDKPLCDQLPGFRLADEAAAATITPRQLLNHSSGIAGDYFEDTGRGDGCTERYVANLHRFGQVHPPGEMFSYCNAGFVVAGRLIEVATGLPFHEALSTRLLSPLGCSSTTVLAEEMLRYRYAVGHQGDRRAGGRGRVAPVSRVLMPRSVAAAGSVTSATAADVLAFARLHLDGGCAPDGRRLLSEGAVSAMQTPTLPLLGLPASDIGLGWILADWSGRRVLWHNGGTFGQLSFLFVLPDAPLAVVLLTNSSTGGRLWRDLGRWVFARLAGVEMPRPPRPPEEPAQLDLAGYAGVYERLSSRVEVAVEEGELLASVRATGPGDADEPAEQFRLTPVDAAHFHTTFDGLGMRVAFSGFDEAGRPRYLHFGSRVSVRDAHPLRAAEHAR
jgi:CubicO group peptidase (beta-lactamase class C family)